jgi:hypothetical protein
VTLDRKSYPPTRTYTVALGLLLAVAPAPVFAADRTTSLSWVRLPGAESCIGARSLAQAVERRLNRRLLVSAAQADVSVEGRIERTAQPDGWHAVVTISSGEGGALGTRELRSTAASCDAVNEELTLIIAVMIDPEAALSAGAPAQPPLSPLVPPSAPPRVVVHRVLVPVPAPRPAPPVPWRAGVEVGPITSLGLLPEPGAGLVIRGRIRPPGFWSFQLGGILWLPSEAAQGGLGSRFTMAQGFLNACPIAGKALGIELAACAGVQIGAVRVGGFGFDLSDQHEQPVVNAHLEGRFTRRLVGPLGVSAGLGVLIPAIRDRFFYRERDQSRREVFRMSPVAGSLDAALGLEFP